MKVLWLCNIMLPAIAKSLGLSHSVKEGWLDGIASTFMEDENPDISLGICFPLKGAIPRLKNTNEKGKSGKNTESSVLKPLHPGVLLTGTVSGVRYYGFKEDTSRPEYYDTGLEPVLSSIIEDFKPDIIHCFGTEYPHTLAMARAVNDPRRLLIGIQGLMGEYSKVYRADLPDSVWNRSTFRDTIRGDSLITQQKKFVKRAEYEREALKLTLNITGRTAWDKQHTGIINSKATYYHLNETLRAPFYKGKWTPGRAQKYSIFVSQGNYPIKGLHYLLKAFPRVLKKYPDACIYAAGDRITGDGSFISNLKLSSYGGYILDLIKGSALQDKIIFTGPLDQKEMMERYLKSHVFVSPSAIENSPNSLGEAMLLSMNVITSDGGGVTSMITNKREGQVVPVGDTRALSEAIMRVFDDKNNAELEKLRQAAGARARLTHDPAKNFNRLIDIYENIVENSDTT